MKSGFVTLSNLDEQHNKVHQGAYLTPETTYISQTKPTVDNMQLGEPRIYNNGSEYWLYFKVNKKQLGKVQLTLE